MVVENAVHVAQDVIPGVKIGNVSESPYPEASKFLFATMCAEHSLVRFASMYDRLECVGDEMGQYAIKYLTIRHQKLQEASGGSVHRQKYPEFFSKRIMGLDVPLRPDLNMLMHFCHHGGIYRTCYDATQPCAFFLRPVWGPILFIDFCYIGARLFVNMLQLQYL